MKLNEMFAEWKSILHPSETYSRMISNASLWGGIQHLLVVTVLSLVIRILFNLRLLPLFFQIAPFETIVFWIATIATQIIVIMAFTAVLWVFARILGGNGDYGVQLHLSSAALAPIFIIMTILTYLPYLGPSINLLLFVYYLYYPTTIAIRDAHKISPVNAIASWFLPLLIIFFFAIIWGEIKSISDAAINILVRL